MAKRRGDGRPTIAQVAKRAGVGTMTASRALRTPHLVSEELRKNVERAVKELNYVPNLSARALASKSADVVAVLVPSLTHHIFAEVVKGIYDGIEPADLQVQIGNTRYDPAIEQHLLEVFLRQRPRAIIVSGTEQTKRSRELLERSGCPVVQIMDITDDPVDRIVGFSHFDAGHSAAKHLIESGYRKIAFISGWMMNRRSSGRRDGYVKALEDANLFNPSLIRTRNKTDAGEDIIESGRRRQGSRAYSTPMMGRELLAELLAEEPNLDAVFCNNDVLALGVLFECIERGISVPEDLGICGFNDFDTMAAATPSLTSVRTFRYDIGYEAIQMVLQALNGRSDLPTIVDKGHRLMVRQSTQKNSSNTAGIAVAEA